jgi:hypothetical protein
VEFVKRWAEICGVNLPTSMSYPSLLRNDTFLHRALGPGTLRDAKLNQFVKPRFDVKGFTGCLKRELYGTGIRGSVCISTPNEGYPVWISDPVKFTTEVRYYVLNGKIVGYGRYDDGPDDGPTPDIGVVTSAIRTLGISSDVACPSGYSLDFGVLDNGKTALVEVNDGWALGYYRGTCSHRDYAMLLWTRWRELVDQSRRT